jgi:hypothetical protein
MAMFYVLYCKKIKANELFALKVDLSLINYFNQKKKMI